MAKSECFIAKNGLVKLILESNLNTNRKRFGEGFDLHRSEVPKMTKRKRLVIFGTPNGNRTHN